MKGRGKEASEQLLKVAKVNKKEMPKDKLTLVDENPTQQRLGDIRDLFSTSTMVTRTLISWFIWYEHLVIDNLFLYLLHLSFPVYPACPP